MSPEQILQKYYSTEINSIFGYMYGQPTVLVFRNGETVLEKDKIIQIRKDELKLGKDEDCFVYVWGWPGPDANIYSFSDYGKTWAFSKEEIAEK